ncbi:hypothetical protein KL929_004131 [Ogataea haglerorum]|nr:hypothetical protein KL948_004215 [Ogataea haglerorum]KAG7738195.1 hypothetical protein KL932_003802 [Ogataea haglerorum]KAG7755375.1 hypothetical protein KL947_004221 [Ogataea haglerorum]KAG7765724.1 hypothetical protein KL931_004375 [Ogataea haglerorum]KAG7786203.1 hypothetical protein KL945_003429 [Ogataea haglerorum]
MSTERAPLRLAVRAAEPPRAPLQDAVCVSALQQRVRHRRRAVRARAAPQAACRGRPARSGPCGVQKRSAASPARPVCHAGAQDRAVARAARAGARGQAAGRHGRAAGASARAVRRAAGTVPREARAAAPDAGRRAGGRRPAEKTLLAENTAAGRRATPV